MHSFISSIVFMVCFIVVCCLISKCFQINLMDFLKHFDKQLKSNIADFIELCIGIYAAVISILASQKTSLTVEISRKGYDVNFVAAISNGLVFNLISIAFLSLAKTDSNFSISIAIALACVSICHFFRFLVYLVLMFCYNMSVIAVENENDEIYKNGLLSELEEIRKALKK